MYPIAVIGAGRIGRIHALNAAAHPQLTVAAVTDPIEEAAQALALEADAQMVPFEAVIADPGIRGVIIASPTQQHLAQAAAAMAAGKAVLCEKPLDLDLARARAAEESLGRGQPLILGFNRRFDRHFAELKRQLSAGRIGALESLLIISHDPAPPPPTYVRTSGGLFKDMAIHDFDMARFLLGEEPTEVFSSASCLIDPAIGEAHDVDTAKTILKTASGKICVISNSRRSGYGYDQRIEAYGENGLLKAENVLESTVSHWGDDGPHADRFQNFFLDRYAQAYRAELDHFADVISGRSQPTVGYHDGVRALELAEAADASMRSGQSVKV